MNTKLEWQTIIRAVMTALGSFLIGTTIFNYQILPELWSNITGVALTLVSLVWGIADKTATIEMIQSALRQVLMFAGGILLAKGYITGNNLTAILALIPIVVPVLQSHTVRVKSNQLAAGKINTQQLKK